MRRLIAVIVLVYLICMGGALALFHFAPEPTSDTVAINDLVKTSQNESWEPHILTEEIDTLYSTMNISREERDRNLFLGISMLMTAFTAASIAMILYVDKRYLKPFRDMEDFAHHVASGNLDTPLLMGKEKSFGAFAESFDLMRCELARAKEAEREANQSKKELIATLSHDIKTPLASIKATSELMAATASPGKQKDSAEIIMGKADQVASLVDNLFTSTMEELHDLEVKPEEVSSKTIEELLQRSDYHKLLALHEIPACLVFADEARLMQVFDNIISNSYKYANTPIEVQTALDSNNLIIDIADYGKGVADEELLLLTQKFYRGTNVDEQPGVGLGLYNAAVFMEGMGGGLTCFNENERFIVRVILPLV